MPGNHSCFCTPGPGDRLRLGPTQARTWSPRLADSSESESDPGSHWQFGSDSECD